MLIKLKFHLNFQIVLKIFKMLLVNHLHLLINLLLKKEDHLMKMMMTIQFLE